MSKIMFIDEYSWVHPGLARLIEERHRAKKMACNLVKKFNPTPHGPSKKKDWHK